MGHSVDKRNPWSVISRLAQLTCPRDVPATILVQRSMQRLRGVVPYLIATSMSIPGHPARVSSRPSGHDLHQLIYLAVGMADDGLPAISVIVSDDDVRVMAGVVGA